MRQQHYTVAGHTFSLEMAEKSPLWRQLQNYEPFLSEPGKNRTFYLKATPETFSIQDFQLIYHADHPAPGDLVMNVFLKDKRYLIEFSSYQEGELTGQLLVDFEKREALLAFTDRPSLQALFLNNALMTCFMLFTLDKNTLLTHASAVINQGKAYLFLGKSGTGKSTHASLWVKHLPGTELLNDDNPAVRIIGGTLYAYGTPWSGKTACYKSLRFPVGGMVRLFQAPVNRFRRQEGADAFVAIYPGCSVIASDKRLRDGLYDTLARLAGMVTVGTMECRPDEEAARVCHRALAGN